jgi:predicted membrane protein
MGTLLRILFTIILIFYAFSMIIKLIFRRKLKKLQQQAEQFTQTNDEPRTHETTKVHIDPNIGEYTEYEEIE